MLDGKPVLELAESPSLWETRAPHRSFTGARVLLVCPADAALHEMSSLLPPEHDKRRGRPRACRQRCAIRPS